MSVSVTQTYGIELQSLENGAFTCPALFASRCRAWAQATFAKQVGAQIIAKRSARLRVSAGLPRLTPFAPPLFSKGATTQSAAAMLKQVQRL
jgi:hypothetical protein